MRKYKRYLCIAVSVMVLFLTGCGTELYNLTEEEEALIVKSAAYILAKHNIHQKDGVNGYPLPDSFEEEPESEIGSENDGDGSGSEVPEVKPPVPDLSALAEQIGHKDRLKITYEGSYLAKSYNEGVAYIVDAQEGKAFYVMKFKLTNTTREAVTINNAANSPQVKLVIETGKVKPEVTFLSNDFMTYQGKIEAGKSVEMILLFEVSEKTAEKISEVELQISVGTSTKNIKLQKK